MKKIILFLITLIIITNVSYASFPVNGDIQAEVVEIPNAKFNDPIDNLTLILAVFWPIFYYVSLPPAFGWVICINPLFFIGSTCVSPFFILALISLLASIVVSIIALKRKKKKGINSNNFTHWKAILSLLMLPLVIILDLLFRYY